jgi:oligoribonuclease
MAKEAFKPQKILWMDLEMTGLDPVNDRIVEVAAIVTDWDFKEIATYEAVVKVDDGLMKTRMVGQFWDEFSGVRDHLMAQNEHGKKPSTVEDALIDFIQEHMGDGKALLAGNSIHQDRRFITSEWPRLDERLHYRMLDVSAWKVVFEGKYGKKFAKPEAHRALDDIKGSIEELKYYLKKVKA